MSWRHRDRAESAADEYGPVTDLVFSLFSVAVLLLGIIGTDSAVSHRNLSERLEKKDSDIAALQDSLAQSRTAAPPETDAQAKSLQAALERLQQENRELRAASVVEAPYRRLELPVIVRPQGQTATFLSGDEVEQRVVEDIRSALVDAYDQLVEISANRILIEIDIAGADRTAGQQDEPDYRLALETASALSRALRGTPMPVACIIAVPYGSVRSGAMIPFTTKPAMNAKLRDFEANRDDPSRAASRQTLARIGLKDTRIRLVAEQVYTSPCDTNALLDGVALWMGADVQSP